MSNKVKSPLMKKAPTYSLRASIISILIGLLTGAVVILIVGAFNPLISLKGAWDGIRLVLFGVLSTGRDAASALTFGFNPTNIGNMLFRATPLILTGVSVAVAFKTGLFNIGAPGQYHSFPVPGAFHPQQQRSRLAHLVHRLPGRCAGRCPVGRYPRPAEGDP